MKTSRKIILLIFFSSTFIPANAQQEKGELVINAGVGYSPGFNGVITVFATPLYPVSYNSTYTPYFSCSSVTPNIGAVIDYGFDGGSSLGLAASYQSEIVNTDYSGNPITNNVTRTNIGLRALYHINRTDKNVDPYIGFRFGFSYYTDGTTTNVPLSLYFLSHTSLGVPSIQFLYGVRFYIADNFGIHFEVGIGSPYIAEVGLSYRINARKPKDK